MEFTVQGPDWNELAKYSRQFMAELGKTGLVEDMDSDYQVGAPELHILPDRKEAIDYSVDIAAIDQTVNAMIGGVIAGTYPSNGHRYDINVKLEDSSQSPYEKIKSLYEKPCTDGGRVDRRNHRINLVDDFCSALRLQPVEQV